MKEFSYGICPYKIIDNQYYILLNKTSAISYFNFFKGKIENDESPSDCAIREFYEEAGIVVKGTHLEDYFSQKSKRKDVGVFLVDWYNYTEDFTFQKDEIFSAEWVKPLDVEVSNNQKKILNDIIAFVIEKEKHLDNVITTV
jgi:8-oxo-dGTP pyrophosphatase MutT (NUDIX family)